MKAVSVLPLPAVFTLSILSLPAPEAAAQTTSSAVPSLELGPSIRASGTGRASTAVFWGGDPDSWANAALLGYHEGLRFEHGKTQLVPDLADDVFFRSDRFSFGKWGIGIAAIGSPFGRNRLDYGESEAVGEQGNLLGYFTSYEEYNGLAVGVSLARALDTVTRLADPSLPELSRYGDVAIGTAYTDVHADLAPAWATEDGREAVGDVKTRDVGLLLRFTPIHSIGGRSLVPILDDAFAGLGGVRLDLAYGYSKHNTGRETITYFGDDEADLLAVPVRKAFAVRAAVGFPEDLSRQHHESGRGWLVQSLTPLVSLGWSRETLDDARFTHWETVHTWGAELSLANVLHLRGGHIEDVDGDVVDSTWGVGLGLDLAGFGGFRVDYASVPQERTLDRVDRWGFTVFADPWEITRAFIGAPEREKGLDPHIER